MSCELQGALSAPVSFCFCWRELAAISRTKLLLPWLAWYCNNLIPWVVLWSGPRPGGTQFWFWHLACNNTPSNIKYEMCYGINNEVSQRVVLFSRTRTRDLIKPQAAPGRPRLITSRTSRTSRPSAIDGARNANILRTACTGRACAPAFVSRVSLWHQC
jgi:hypothetical protein